MRKWGHVELPLSGNSWRQVATAFVLGGVIMLTLIVLASLSIAQYRAYNLRSLDLGRMAQAMWSVRYGLPLVWTGDGVDWSRLANHVEVVYFLIAPVYAIWPSPASLLLVQSALFVSGAVPVYRLSHRHLDSRAGLLLAVVYLAYPVAQTAVLFELHGDTLAAPLLLWAVEAADRQSWRAYIVWILLALACKMHVSAAVALLGGVLWWYGHRRVGAATTLLALIWGATAFFVVRDFFAPQGTEATATPLAYVSYYFLNGGVLATLPERAITAVIVFWSGHPVSLARAVVALAGSGRSHPGASEQRPGSVLRLPLSPLRSRRAIPRRRRGLWSRRDAPDGGRGRRLARPDLACLCRYPSVQFHVSRHATQSALFLFR